MQGSGHDTQTGFALTLDFRLCVMLFRTLHISPLLRYSILLWSLSLSPRMSMAFISKHYPTSGTLPEYKNEY
jgi:hypothetical protein